MWRGSLLPLGCAAAPRPGATVCQVDVGSVMGGASRPSGSKLPRHKCVPHPKPAAAQAMSIGYRRMSAAATTSIRDTALLNRPSRLL
ncbi:hypothetical protein CEQ51_01405 [Pseudomonas thivervalensis]|uniref:Uncharacterized protein n=1 Tax=Pseudomonas thivervalensis TaxID=86265 RepID=A0A2Z4Z4J0_9PSED|nr:hypothetical protein CE140_01405 [Pseudomonas thivervalensis]AXA58782.1 hypothetical protein CEQ51_01405 [Pseudomonas thivervalensis]